MSFFSSKNTAFALRLGALATPLFLGACILPPAVTVASTAIDGFSFLVSGKTMTSHALSFIAQRDCSLSRALAAADVTAICRPGAETLLAFTADVPQDDRDKGGMSVPPSMASEQSATPRLVAATAASASSAPAAPFILVTAPAKSPTLAVDAAILAPPPRPNPRPILLAALDDDLSLASAVASPEPASVKQPPGQPSGQPPGQPAEQPPGEADAANRPALYLVVGSFRLADRAQAMIAHLAELSPGMAIGIVKGKVWFRVVVGPLDGDAVAAMRATMTERGVPGAWAIRLCAADLTTPPCKPLGSPASIRPMMTLTAVDMPD